MSDEKLENLPVTVGWLWEICPDSWHRGSRGIMHGNWHINSVRNRPLNVPPPSNGYWEGMDAGPFVWSFAPSHDLNFTLLDKPCSNFYSVLVLKKRDDVLQLLRLLEVQ